MFHDLSLAAKIRRAQIEGGKDLTFSHVFLPYYKSLLAEVGPKRVLEVGCGTGHLAKTLAEMTSELVAIEPSAGMYEVAKQILQETLVNLQNVTLEQFTTERTFELTLAHLCAQIIPDLDSFCAHCARNISPQGLLVFSIPHPCFWNEYRVYFPKDSFQYVDERFTTTSLKISNDPCTPIENVPYYHRPIGRYLSAIARAGLCLERLDEIFPDKNTQALYPGPWANPRYCVFRARKRYDSGQF